MFALSILLIIFLCVYLLNLDKSRVKEKFYFFGYLITLRLILISIFTLLLPLVAEGGFSFKIIDWLILLLTTGGLFSLIPDNTKENFFLNYIESAYKTLINNLAWAENRIIDIKKLLQDLIESYIKYKNAKLNASNIIVEDRNRYLNQKSIKAKPRQIPFYERPAYKYNPFRITKSEPL